MGCVYVAMLVIVIVRLDSDSPFDIFAYIQAFHSLGTMTLGLDGR
jgi:hypothetical protein